MKVLFEGWRRFINENENENFIDYIAEIAQVMIDSIKTELENAAAMKDEFLKQDKLASIEKVNDILVEKIKKLRDQALKSIETICTAHGASVDLCIDEFNNRLKAALEKENLPAELFL